MNYLDSINQLTAMECQNTSDLEKSEANTLKVYTDVYQSNHELIEKTASLPSDVGAEELKNLKDHFGYSSFRPVQWTIINAVMNEKRDVCAVLAPGYGRSLCYQYPAVCSDGTVLVISPLIYKIEEEVRSMTISNVSTLFLDTCDKSSVEESLKGNYSIIYLNSDIFPSFEKSPLKLVDIKLIVIDEAHCVSEWGHDYRVVYKKLQKVKNIFPNVPLLALTSSPSPPVRDDIISHFKMSDPLIVCSDFDRPKLKFEVLVSTETSIKALLELLHTNPTEWKNLFNESTIIYVEKRSSASIVQKELKKYNYSIAQSKRNYAIERFMNDETKVLVTTMSYGLRVHKPDIRNIIHMYCPKDIESYYQEIGIGGRDGLPTRCILFCTPICFDVPSYIQDVMAQTRDEITDRRTLLIKLMAIFLTTKSCRNHFLRCFRGETLSVVESKQDCCDNCTYELLKNDRYHYSDLGLDVFGKYDVGNDYVRYLEALQKNNSKCSIDAIASLLAAEATDDTIAVHKSARWWQGIGNLLTSQDYIENYFLQKHEVSYPCGIKPHGKAFLSQKPAAGEMMETPNYLMYKELLYTYTTINTTVSSKLESFQQRLLQRRLELAKLCGCACFTIASNEVIKTLNIAKPRTFAALQKLDLYGFNRRRIEIFGRDFVRVILDNLGDSWFIFCSTFKSGVGFHESRKRRITIQMAYEFTATGLRNGFVFDWSKLGITDEMKQKVSDVVTKYEKMFLSSTPDWSSSEDLKRFASLDIEIGHILVIWTYFHQLHTLRLEFPKKGNKISMAETLFKHPVPMTIPNFEWHFLSLLGIHSADLSRIAEIKNIPVKKIWDSIATAIMKGHEIKLSHFGVNDPESVEEAATRVLCKTEFSEVPNFTNTGELFKQTGLPNLSKKMAQGQALIIWSYLYVRIHLYSLRVEFYDFDPPSHKLKRILLKESDSKRSKKAADESSNRKGNSKSKKNRVGRSEKTSKKTKNPKILEDVHVDDKTVERAKDVPKAQALKRRKSGANDEKTKSKKIKNGVDKQNKDVENPKRDEDVSMDD